MQGRFRKRIRGEYDGEIFVGHSNDQGTYDFWKESSLEPAPPEVSEELNRLVLKEAEKNGPKRNKHGILQIFSSDKKHSFGYGCWVSRKYSGKYSILLGIAGKRYLYTISKEDLEAKILMEQRALRRALLHCPT
jgi:hypothetical protein